MCSVVIHKSYGADAGFSAAELLLEYLLVAISGTTSSHGIFQSLFNTAIDVGKNVTCLEVNQRFWTILPDALFIGVIKKYVIWRIWYRNVAERVAGHGARENPPSSLFSLYSNFQRALSSLSYQHLYGKTGQSTVPNAFISACHFSSLCSLDFVHKTLLSPFKIPSTWEVCPITFSHSIILMSHPGNDAVPAAKAKGQQLITAKA